MNFSIVYLLISILGCNVTSQVLDTTPIPLTLTSFTCHGRLPGYYADLETGCKTYHLCDGNSHFTYVCPKRTLFQQRSKICDHLYLVRCEDSPHFFPNDEEESPFPLAESEEKRPSKEEYPENDDQEKEFTSTNPSEFATETTDEPAEVSTPPTSSTRTTTNEKTLSESAKESFSSQSIQKFLKIRLNDFRSLFFIPEFDENTLVAKLEQEFVLPVEKSDFMKFKNRENVFKSFSLCPTHCNPKFFLPGTCHPCIMIK